MGLLRVPNLMGQGRAREVLLTCPFSYTESTPLTPLVPLPLLANLPNCHLCFGSQQDWWSMPVLHKWMEPQPPSVFQLSLVSNPINTRTQCNVDSCSQI